MSCLGAVLEQRGLQGGGSHLLVDLNSCRPHARNTMLGIQIINADQNSTPLYKKNLKKDHQTENICLITDPQHCLIASVSDPD